MQILAIAAAIAAFCAWQPIPIRSAHFGGGIRAEDPRVAADIDAVLHPAQ